MIREYEMVYVLNPTLGEESVTTLQERVKDLVEANATELQIEDWGRKKLAYEIEDQREGLYALATFKAEEHAPREIERILRITDGVLRYLIIRKES